MTPPSVRFDAYVIDTLMRDLIAHDRQPCAFIVYLTLWRQRSGAHKWPVVSMTRMTACTSRAICTGA